MTNVFSRCSKELSFRNHQVYEGKDWCRDCLREFEAEQASGVHSIGAGQGYIGSPVMTRYRDAYGIGAALVGLGNTIKVVGGILGALILFVSFASANGFGGMAVVVGGILFATLVGVLFWVCGVMVAAQGQILQATLDNTVANSPFLTDQERVAAMGLPRNV